MNAGKVDVLAVMETAAGNLSTATQTSWAEGDELREARAAVAELIEAAKTVMAKHDAEAVSCNFSYCGCDYCGALRAALARIGGAS